ncbi:SpaA isopeptide-forming pilin-related protein [Leucobacter salsicius]|uniref:SpaA isopeptide-forming pilin-related protein n=1 Tax=Leucobacter salsicius TaxID=664638 RepID=UPI0012FBD8E4|nr:SpaA isopeptide-forming pilin-related protein [Leucobacter salsicius]
MKLSDLPGAQRVRRVELQAPAMRLKAQDVMKVTTVSVLCAAFAVLGAGPAYATTFQNSPVGQDQVDPAHTTQQSAGQASTGQQAAEPSSPAPQTPAAESAAPELVSPESVVPPASSSEAPQNALEQNTAQSQVPTSLPGHVAVPYLRWSVSDAQGALVGDTTFTVQLAGSDAPSADGTPGWAGAVTATVLDNVGQPNYSGADFDPAPGVFTVKTLIDDADAARSQEIAGGDVARVRLATAAESLKAGEAASWTDVKITLNRDDETVRVVAEQASASINMLRDPAPENIVVPLVAGAPDGATAPYVYWNVTDQDGNPVAGATFTFERRNNNWTGLRTVTDCVSGTCTGVDRDNDPGEFSVKWIDSDTPGADPGSGRLAVEANGRYRLQPINPPPGYTWTSGTGRVDSNSKNWSGADNNRTLNFGTFSVARVNYAPSCVAGYVYGIQSSGQIRQVTPGGSVTNLGSTSGLSGAEFNGLGIGTGGSPVYAYSRGGTGNSTSKVAIYQYNPATGNWSNRNVSVDSNDTGFTFVAGAVNLSTGKYFLGGYRGDGNNRIFRLWEYTPSSNTVAYKGAVSAPGSGNANGDIAFDANGNLFVVRGAGTTTTIYSVTAADLAAANGGTIPSSPSSPVQNTTQDVNGVAFDADGTGFLGGGKEVQRYDMPGWTNQATVTSGSGLDGSTDLASCGSPPTITIEKVIEGGRVAASDQFTLSLNQGSTLISSATTTGNSVGVQADRIGPLPTVRNVPLTFKETAAGTTDLSGYVSSYRCLIDGVQASQGNGTSGSVTIPVTGQAVNCQIYNAPLVAQVTVHKDVTDAQGANPQPKEGWTVSATAVATTGSMTARDGNPTDSTTTNEAGDATWNYKFGAKTDVGAVTVSEEVTPGYAFQSGACVVTHLDGTSTTTELAGPAEQTLAGIVPGDRVDCGYVNRLQPNELTLIKKVTNKHGGTGVVADWTLTAEGPTAGVTGITGDAAITNASVEAGEYTLSESDGPQGYLASAWECTNGEDTLDTTGSKVTVPTAGKVVCTITNSDLPGSVTWSKVETGTNDLLGGSVWTLTGPGADGASVEVEDCTEGDCAGMHDQDPGAGKFLIEELSWGAYQLEETRAPLGYVLDTSTTHEFEIAGGALEITVDPINNDPVPSPQIPLTGGIGRELYTIAGFGVLTLAAAAIGVNRIQKRRR